MLVRGGILIEEVEVLEDILTEIEEAELRATLDHMVETVKTYCYRDGKATASEKRIIKAMKETTNSLAEEIVKLYEEQTLVEDLTLLEVVNRNREKILKYF